MQFVSEGMASPGAVNRVAEQDIRAAFILGRHRTPTQDVDYAVHQLVEIGVRALSPGVNDLFTAIACVDWLGAALTLMAERAVGSGVVRSSDGKIRLAQEMPSFERMLRAAFNQIRQHGCGNVAVCIRSLGALDLGSQIATRSARRSLAPRRGAREGVSLFTETRPSEQRSLGAKEPWRNVGIFMNRGLRHVASRTRSSSDARAVLAEADKILQSIDARAIHPSDLEDVKKRYDRLRDSRAYPNGLSETGEPAEP